MSDQQDLDERLELKEDKDAERRVNRAKAKPKHKPNKAEDTELPEEDDTMGAAAAPRPDSSAAAREQAVDRVEKVLNGEKYEPDGDEDTSDEENV
eukprot:3333768-Alexandrium_andersonii.AAC.1